MYTAGQNAIYLQEGVSGLVLYYAGVPFNALSTFVPPLPPEQRYNPLWLRARPNEPPLVLWPCISPPDLVDNVSLEALLLKLRRLQTGGQVDCDLLVHLNFDADAETWLPVDLPRAFAWFPNTGGLVEYIDVVNHHPWAEFTLPSTYARHHPPRGELLVRQDLADGGFDGNYSWAEKCSSLHNWTALEGSRLHTYRAEALARRLPGPLAGDLRRRLWEGRDSPFFQRLVGLTTTHFGMSTPVINEERQARAEALLGGACDGAAALERQAAVALCEPSSAALPSDVLYELDIYRPLVEGQEVGSGPAPGVRTIVRLPLVLPRGVDAIRAALDGAPPRPAPLVNLNRLRDGRLAGEMLLPLEFVSSEPRRCRVYTAVPTAPSSEPPDRLRNRWLELRLSEETGVAGLTFEGQALGGSGFLAPFITYNHGRKPQRWAPADYRFERLEGERWQGLSRARLAAEIVMDTPHGPATSEVHYTFTLFDDVPYLLLDVDVGYARTAAQQAIQTVQQRLRRLLDLRW
ncbi:MAG: hypothetical protein P8129_24375, partial [Anaerolineae bacterium]